MPKGASVASVRGVVKCWRYWTHVF